MSKYGLLLPNGAPQSLVSLRQNEAVDEGLRLRKDGPSFDDILAGQMPAGQVKIAAEAQESLKLHGISLSPLELDELANAIDRFSEVGRKRGLVLSDRGAFTIDVDRREIECMTPRQQVKGQLFEGIDSFIGI